MLPTQIQQPSNKKQTDTVPLRVHSFTNKANAGKEDLCQYLYSILQVSNFTRNGLHWVALVCEDGLAWLVGIICTHRV